MRDVELARLVARDQVVGIAARVGEDELVERAGFDAVHHQVAILAVEDGAALLADRVEFHRLARGDHFTPRGAAPDARCWC